MPTTLRGTAVLTAGLGLLALSGCGGSALTATGGGPTAAPAVATPAVATAAPTPRPSTTCYRLWSVSDLYSPSDWHTSFEVAATGPDAHRACAAEDSNDGEYTPGDGSNGVLDFGYHVTPALAPEVDHRPYVCTMASGRDTAVYPQGDPLHQDKSTLGLDVTFRVYSTDPGNNPSSVKTATSWCG